MEFEKAVELAKGFWANGNHSTIINFRELLNYSPELADALLENSDILKALEYAYEATYGQKAVIRVDNLIPSAEVKISDVRAEHISKFISLQGLIKQKSNIRPELVAATFDCPACGNPIYCLQDEDTIKEPTICSCGRKGKFRMISKEFIDVQTIVLEESPDDVDHQPARFTLVLRGDLCSPLNVRKIDPGEKIYATGVVREIKNYVRNKPSRKYNLIFEVNFFKPVIEKTFDKTISKEDLRAIKSIGALPLSEKIKYVAPTVYGFEKIKEALLLFLVKGVWKTLPDGTNRRGDIHILFMGDPGTGKTMLGKSITQLAYKARYCSGKSTTGTGVTAAMSKDEFGNWSLDAGPLVMSNGSILVIDEFEKMTREDQSNLHEAMSIGTITITKANIQATLQARTSILALANPPELGRFDRAIPLPKQIGLPFSLLNRFDLIFPFFDTIDSSEECKVEWIMREQRGETNIPISDEQYTIFKKFILYAQKLEPKLTKESLDVLKAFYLNLRKKGIDTETIPITLRQLDGLIRMTEAYAKLRLAKETSVQDAEAATSMMLHFLTTMGLTPEGKVDIDIIEFGATSRDRKADIILNLIQHEIEEVELIKKAEAKGIAPAEAEKLISLLLRNGDLFSPKSGWVKRL